MDINIDRLSEEQLIALNRRIVERIKIIRQHKTLNSMIKFNVGQRVSFQSYDRVITGVIIKFNPKTLVVLTDDNQQWKVSPQLIKPLIEAEQADKLTKLRRVE
jgi:hypothetical protein